MWSLCVHKYSPFKRVSSFLCPRVLVILKRKTKSNIYWEIKINIKSSLVHVYHDTFCVYFYVTYILFSMLWTILDSPFLLTLSSPTNSSCAVDELFPDVFNSCDWNNKIFTSVLWRIRNKIELCFSTWSYPVWPASVIKESLFYNVYCWCLCKKKLSNCRSVSLYVGPRFYSTDQ